MQRLFYAIIFVCSFLLNQIPVFCQPFTLVKDINAGSLNSCINPRPQPLNLTELGLSLFFTVSNLEAPGLWKSDGSFGGTALVKQIPGIQTMVKAGSNLFFTAYNANTATQELWKSDGTEAGTTLIYTWVNFSVSSLTSSNGIVYFSQYTGSSYDLWKSDGTTGGTIALKSFNFLKNLVDVNGDLFFSASENVPPYHDKLWKSDGTTAGTVLIKDIFVGPQPPDFSGFFDANGVLYFVGNDGATGPELWKSDGTDAGTVMVANIEPGSAGSNIRSFVLSNNILYFFTYTTAYGIGLWKSDGTPGGTSLVKDLSDINSPMHLTDVDGTLFFQGYDDVHGAELWKSDGTDAGTVMVKDIFSGVDDGGYPRDSNPFSLFNFNGTLYFSANNEIVAEGFGPIDCNPLGELWKSDGSEAGTVLVKDIYKGLGGGAPLGFTVVNGSMFFRANNGLYGRELWKSDGTPNGTIMVKDIFTTSGSQPKWFTAMNNKVYFAAFNSDSGPGFGRGTEIYQTNGTLSGTGQSTWIFRLGGSNPKEIKAHNGELFISATDGTGYELWKTNGLGLSQGNTTLVKNINPNTGAGERASNPAHFTSVGAVLLFSANDGTYGYELWKTDGTETGTVLVKDINTTGDSNPANLVNIGGTLYFTADNGTDGIELWKSDGTDAGTLMVKNINEGGSSNPTYLTNVNGTLYFAADNGIDGVELWKSNGTDAGTVLVKNINASISNSNPTSLTNVNGILYFAADDGVNGVEVWKSNGTEAETVLVKDINPAGSSNPSLFTSINSVVVFAADDGFAGRELWGSNGTTAGTILIKDILAGTAGSNPTALTRVGNNVLFAANDGDHGNEVWLSNGAESGTRLMSEIEPGATGSNPTEFFEFGSKVLVAATNTMVGSEVWIADVPAGAPLPLHLLEFKGTIVDNNGVLQWKTENEENTSSFIVERSIDGRNYQSVGSVSAANTPGIHYYDFTDVNITSLGVNKIYYRLKQTDIDGRFTYSNIIVLSIDNSRPVVMLYPNPAKDNLNITITVPFNEKLQWQLTDNAGRIVKRGNYNLTSGSTALSIDISGLNSGMYVMQLDGTTLRQVIKVVKQ